MEINFNELYKWVTKNFGFKVVSFIAALALWSGFVGRGEYILDIEIGLNYLVPSTYSIKSAPEYLKVRLKGPEMAMKKFSRNARAVTINLTGKPPGEHQISITRAMLDLPPGIQVLSKSPETITVDMVGPDTEGSRGH